jgi:Sugar (and other) transporter
MNAVQILLAAVGSMFVDSIGRRPMLIWVNIGCAVCWIGVTASAGVQASTGSKASSGACVAMIYIFQAVYSFGWTPLQALYPVEVLSFEMRAKGMAFSNMFVTCGKLYPPNGIILQRINSIRYPRQPIWFPSCLAEHHLEDIHCLPRLVFHPSCHHLVAHARDQEPHCESKSPPKY